MDVRKVLTGAPLRAIALSITASLLACAVPAQAGRLESPLEMMYAPDTTLMVGRLIEINPAGRIVLERKDVLSGKVRPPDKIDVQVPVEVLGTLKTGERYVIAYSTYRRDPRKPVGMVGNTGGATVLASTGIDPALFSDTRQTRAILKAGNSERGRESRRMLDLLLAALAGADPQLQNLAAGEIALQPEIGEHLRDSDRSALEKIVRDTKTPTRVRITLLEASARRSKDLGAWWQPSALEIVTTTPVDGYPDKASDPVSLVLLALEVLDRYAVKVPPDTLKRWVWNANPALVERVCVMLRREAPEQERSTIQLALADQKLPEPTRKFLNDHLRRLDRLNERTRKEGSG